jgi:hypothetical protein
MIPRIAFVVLVAACSGSNGTTPIDGHSGGSDSASTVPAMITISGQALQQDQSGETPVAGVAISAFASSNESAPLASTTTDASGNYTLMIATQGQPIDGYIKATMSGLVDTYVYPPVPMAKDQTNAVASMITTSNYNALVGFEGASASNGMIILVVLDSSAANTIMGATVATSPTSGKVRYMDGNMQPFATASTNTDGLAFLFDVPPGSVSVSANKSGMSFASHGIKARAGALTTTIVQAH